MDPKDLEMRLFKLIIKFPEKLADSHVSFTLANDASSIEKTDSALRVAGKYNCVIEDVGINFPETFDWEWAPIFLNNYVEFKKMTLNHYDQFILLEK